MGRIKGQPFAGRQAEDRKHSSKQADWGSDALVMVLLYSAKTNLFGRVATAFRLSKPNRVELRSKHIFVRSICSGDSGKLLTHPPSLQGQKQRGSSSRRSSERKHRQAWLLLDSGIRGCTTGGGYFFDQSHPSPAHHPPPPLFPFRICIPMAHTTVAYNSGRWSRPARALAAYVIMWQGIWTSPKVGYLLAVITQESRHVR